MQRLSALTHARFGLFRVRSPLLTESRLFSSPVGTEMFHFPTFPPTTLYIQVEVAGHNSGHFRGFPIRKSTDQSSFTSSPWLIAGYNVLHRLLMPRHPPIALSSLSPQQKINYKDARVHYTILKQHDTPTPASQSQPTKGTQKHPNLKPGPRPKAWEPNSVHTPTNPPTTSPSTPTPPQQGSRQYQTRQQTQSARTRSMLPQQKTPPPCTTRHRQKCEWTTTKGRQKAP